jgi:hypothetical protein
VEVEEDYRRAVLARIETTRNAVLGR